MSETAAGLPLDAETLDRVRFDDAGLVPVVAQDRDSGAVLMLGWANREALERTLATGDLHFWSRSRQELWRKGETSGNVLTEAELRGDCDGDSVLAYVTPTGPACHTGAATCWGEPETFVDAAERHDVLARLAATLDARARDRPAGSYTVRLLDDPNLRVKKLGEELAELIVALGSADPDAAVEEAADLVYHTMVAVTGAGRRWADVEAELERRAAG